MEYTHEAIITQLSSPIHYGVPGSWPHETCLVALSWYTALIAAHPDIPVPNHYNQLGKLCFYWSPQDVFVYVNIRVEADNQVRIYGHIDPHGWWNKCELPERQAEFIDRFIAYLKPRINKLVP